MTMQTDVTRPHPASGDEPVAGHEPLAVSARTGAANVPGSGA